MSDLPPADAEYTRAHVVFGHGPHAGLYAIELIGHADCWQSGWSWADPEMAARAGRTLLSRSQRGGRRMSFLCTEEAFVRLDSTGNPIPVAIAIHFEIESYRLGSPATRTDPADAAEYEFAVTLVELDGQPETPGPITDAERMAALAWFMEHGHDEACELADVPDDEADPDDARDRQFDDDADDRWAA